MTDGPRILVMGASGTIGRVVAELLVAEGVACRAGYRSRPVAVVGAEPVRTDVATGEGIARALEGIDKLFLLTGDMPGQSEAETRVVDAAAQAGVTHIVKLSTWGAESEAFSIARIHRPVEIAIEQSGMAHTFLRPNGFMQNFATYYRDMIVHGGAVRLPCEDARISFIDARDIAAAAVRALLDPTHAGKAYDLSGPEALTFHDAANHLAAASGRPVAYVSIPEDLFRSEMRDAGVPAAYVQDLVELCASYRSGASAAVTSAIGDITGRPGITFDIFARDHAEALR